MNKFSRTAFLLAALLTLVGCASEHLEWRNTEVVRGALYKRGANEPLNGVVSNVPMSYVTSNESGYIQALMQVEKLTNTALSIYGGGSILACDVKVDDGLLVGKTECVRQDGSKAIELSLKDGAIDGEVRLFNPGDSKPILTFEIHDGVLEGPMNYYFRDARKINREATARKGRWDGEFFVYNADGDVINEGHFREGVQVGVWKDYWANTGKVRNVTVFDVDGNPTQRESYNANGERVD
ncbi:hypothetical protein [Xanthomonas phage RTH11]|nr:hypothetical protein [Xanthomonas phage RTH11]